MSRSWYRRTRTGSLLCWWLCCLRGPSS